MTNQKTDESIESMINVMELIKGQRLICLSLRMRISEIEQILKTTRHSGYPIIGKGQLLSISTVRLSNSDILAGFPN